MPIPSASTDTPAAAPLRAGAATPARGRWQRGVRLAGWIALSALLHAALIGGLRWRSEFGADGADQHAAIVVELVDPAAEVAEPAAPTPVEPATPPDTARTPDAPRPVRAPAAAAAAPATPRAAPRSPASAADAPADPATRAPAPADPDPAPMPRLASTPSDTPRDAPDAQAATATPQPEADAQAAAPADPPPVDSPSPVPGTRAEMRAVPPSRRLDFSAHGVIGGHDYWGKGAIRWQIGAGRYQLDQDVALDLLVTTLRLQNSTSAGLLSEHGLEPIRYTEKTRTRALVATNFNRDPEHNSISFSATTAVLPLEPGAQDRASIVMQLATLFASRDAEMRPGARFHVLLAGVRGAETWTLTVAETETIATGLGPMEARRIVREPRPDSRDSRVEVWFAPRIGFLPARIRYTEANGNVTEMTLDDLAVLPDLQP